MADSWSGRGGGKGNVQDEPGTRKEGIRVPESYQKNQEPS